MAELGFRVASVVVVPTVAEQKGAEMVIVPEGVNLPDRVPLFRAGSYATRDICGWATNFRLEDGRVMADLECELLSDIESIGYGLLARETVGPEIVVADLLELHTGHLPVKEEIIQ